MNIRLPSIDDRAIITINRSLSNDYATHEH